MDEIELLEQATGKEINELFGSGNLSAKATKLMVWLLMKRQNPNVDVAEAGKLTLEASANYIKDYVENPKAQ
jgi:hypothetical protein